MTDHLLIVCFKSGYNKRRTKDGKRLVIDRVVLCWHLLVDMRYLKYTLKDVPSEFRSCAPWTKEYPKGPFCCCSFHLFAPLRNHAAASHVVLQNINPAAPWQLFEVTLLTKLQESQADSRWLRVRPWGDTPSTTGGEPPATRRQTVSRSQVRAL